MAKYPTTDYPAGLFKELDYYLGNKVKHGITQWELRRPFRYPSKKRINVHFKNRKVSKNITTSCEQVLMYLNTNLSVKRYNRKAYNIQFNSTHKTKVTTYLQSDIIYKMHQIVFVVIFNFGNIRLAELVPGAYNIILNRSVNHLP